MRKIANTEHENDLLSLLNQGRKPNEIIEILGNKGIKVTRQTIWNYKKKFRNEIKNVAIDLKLEVEELARDERERNIRLCSLVDHALMKFLIALSDKAEQIKTKGISSAAELTAVTNATNTLHKLKGMFEETVRIKRSITETAPLVYNVE